MSVETISEILQKFAMTEQMMESDALLDVYQSIQTGPALEEILQQMTFACQSMVTET